MTMMMARPMSTTADGPPGGTPEPTDPTERPDVDPHPEPGLGDDDPEVNPPADPA
jgi:hypothetical protein